MFNEGTVILNITYFDADLENEIQSFFPSVININGDSERSGVEVSATYQPHESTYITTEYTYTDADDPSGEEVRRPQHKASLSAARTFMNDKLRITASLVFNGEQLDTDFRNFFSNGFVAEQTELDDYTLVNLGASYKVTDRLEIYARIENLFDEDYQNVLSYAAPGRSVYGGVRVRLGQANRN